MQFSVGTVKRPETAVIGVVDGPMTYPDQLLLIANGGPCTASVFRTTATRPFAFLALKVSVQRSPWSAGGSTTLTWPLHRTRFGFFPLQRRGLEDRVQRVEPEVDHLIAVRPPT